MQQEGWGPWGSDGWQYRMKNQAGALAERPPTVLCSRIAFPQPVTLCRKASASVPLCRPCTSPSSSSPSP